MPRFYSLTFAANLDPTTYVCPGCRSSFSHIIRKFFLSASRITASIKSALFGFSAFYYSQNDNF
jgi:hypothetical protein